MLKRLLRKSRRRALAMLAGAPLLLFGRRAPAQVMQQSPGATTGGPAVNYGGPTPFLVRAKSFAVTGGTKPGDNQTLKLTVEHSGGSGSRSVPWRIARDNDIVLHSGTQQVNAGSTATFEVTRNWTAPGGSYQLFGEVDPNRTLNEPSGQTANNLSAPVTRVYSDWSSWGTKARDGARAAVLSGLGGVRYRQGKINGPVLTGGRLEGSVPLHTQIRAQMVSAGAPQSLADSFGLAVQEAWNAWQNGWTIPSPGLPLFPSFAAVPASVAPSIPAPGFPLNPAVSSGFSKLTPASLASAIRSRVGAARDWPGGHAAIESFANWFAGRFAAWSATQTLMAVMGSGPVPSFAPPFVPTGPVVNGTAQQTHPSWNLGAWNN